jgi:hypothetical protein
VVDEASCDDFKGLGLIFFGRDPHPPVISKEGSSGTPGAVRELGTFSPLHSLCIVYWLFGVLKKYSYFKITFT